MPIVLYGWRIGQKLVICSVVLLAISFSAVFWGLILSDSEFGHRVSSLVHQPTEKINVGISHTKNAGSNTSRPAHNTIGYGSDSYCTTFPDPGNLALVIKTGASELYSKLPAQLTSLPCVSSPLILSDLEQRLGPYQVHDVLSAVTRGVKAENPEFAIYNLQQEHASSGNIEDMRKLKNIPIVSEDWRTEGKSAAWGLDKYKFLHMIERSWELAPDKDWYFYLEADTFLSWPNLLRWIKTLDPQKVSYFGNAIRMYEAPYRQPFFFGHGGAGVLLSGAAVREFAVARKGLAGRWDNRIAKMWFGDYVLAAALHEELALEITNMSPSMTENEPAAIAFHGEMWCLPVITLHHIHPQFQDSFAHHDRERATSPMLLRDVYLEAFPKGLPRNRTNWDNLIDETTLSIRMPDNQTTVHQLQEPHQSSQSCEIACRQDDQCMQFSYITSSTMPSEGSYNLSTECHLSHAFKLGKAREPESNVESGGSGKSWGSGWMTERIAAWVDKHEGCHAEFRD